MAELTPLSGPAEELLSGVAVDRYVLESTGTELDTYNAPAYELVDEAVRHVDGRFEGKLGRSEFDSEVIQCIRATARARGDAHLGQDGAAIVQVARVLNTQIREYADSQKPPTKRSH